MTTANSLKIVRPVIVDDTVFVSSDVPENDHATWLVGTTYALGDRVILNHKIYESLQAANTGNNPATAFAWWVEVSATNRWKVFDGSRSTQTLQATSMQYVLAPGKAVSNLSVLHVDNATSVRLQMIDGTYGTVKDETIDMTPIPQAPDWYAWFFGDRVAPTVAIFDDLPSYPSAQLTVDIEGGSSLAVGVILFGQVRYIGLGIHAGARIGITDYSRKEVNEWGDTVLVQRAFSKRASFEMLLERSEVDTTAQLLADIRATPCLWIGSGRYESTILYGYYKTFDINISYPDFSECLLEIEGLT